MYEIYLITNQINEKMYVGQSSRGICARLKNHISKAQNTSGLSLHRAMRKYGYDRFSINLLATAKDQEELNRLEMFWIKILNTKVPNGYNMTKGGETPQELSEESKEKHRVSHLGKRASKYRHDLDNKELVSLYESGKSILEISKIVGANKKTVHSRLKNCGVRFRGPADRNPSNYSRYRKDVKDSSILDLFYKGWSYQKIGDRFGMFSSGIASRLQKLGIRRPLKNNNLPVQEVISLYIKGYGSEEIGKKFGVSRTSICNLLATNQIPRRKGRSKSLRFTTEELDLESSTKISETPGHVAALRAFLPSLPSLDNDVASEASKGPVQTSLSC